MRTNEGWWMFNFADKAQLVRPTATDEIKVEVLIDGDDYPDTNERMTALLTCLTSVPPFSRQPKAWIPELYHAQCGPDHDH